MLYGDRRQELAQGYRNTTNNRMELMAVIAALERLTRPCKVTLYSDSQYVVDSISKRWVYSWQRNGWRKSDKKPALNVDLWRRLLPLLEEHEVEFKWVRGHNNNVENERCDVLAVGAVQSGDLLVDAGFNNAEAKV